MTVDARGNVTSITNGTASPFTAKFASSPQAMPPAGGTATFVHSLGSIPFNYDIFLECVTANAGYSPGAIVKFTTTSAEYSGNSPFFGGIGVWADATNVYAIVDSSGNVALKSPSTGVHSVIVLADWNIVAKAWV